MEKKTLIFVSLFLCLTAIAFFYLNPKQSYSPEQSSETKSADPEIDFSALIGFVENKGQILNQHGQPNQKVKYHYVADELRVQLRETGFSYELVQVDSTEEMPNLLTHRIDIQFLNAQAAQIIAAAPTSVTRNFYQHYDSSKELTGIKTFRKVIYKELYPNIDLSFDINEDGQMEYHFIVHEGGDPALIQLAYQGQNGLALADNKVQIETRFGLMEEVIPRSWYEHEGKLEEVAVQYQAIADDILAFNAPTGQGDLIIDPIPVLTWSKDIAPGRTDGKAVSADSDGNIYVTGETTIFDGFATAGAHKTEHSTDPYFFYSDAFLMKLNSAGTTLWATYYGGTMLKQNRGLAVVADNNGNVYFGGDTESYTGIATAGTHSSSHSGFDTQAFLAKFNSSGVRQWGTYYGGEEDETIVDIVLDGNGDIITVGVTKSISEPGSIATLGAHQTTFGGGNTDGFIAKFDDTGDLVWGTFYGGSGEDKVEGVHLNANDEIFIAGTTNSADGIGTSGTYQSSLAGDEDGFFAKFNNSGVRQWGSYYGGLAMDNIRDIALDGNGNIFLVGRSESSSGVTTSGSHQPVLQGNRDAILVKMDGNGVRQWATYFGGPGNDAGNHMDVFADGSVVFIGSTSSATGISDVCSPVATIPESGGTYITKFTSSGNHVWGTYSLSFGLTDVDIDDDDNIIVGIDARFLRKYHEEESNPEIKITGNGLNINNGDTSPRTADGTNFGAYSSCTPITQTFIIENVGGGCLALSGTPIIQLSDDTHFTVTAQPNNASVFADQTESFDITYEPVASGTHTVTVTILNNDSNEDPFTFTIRGNSGNRAIEVRGNNVLIANGDMSPSLSDHTDFGIITICNGNPIRTYTITNPGTACLNISSVSLTNSNAFKVEQAPAQFLEGGASTTFQIALKQKTPGIKTTTVTIVSTDGDENPFTFDIQADVGQPTFELTQGGVVLSQQVPHDWGTVSFCEVHTRTYTLTNTGVGCIYLTDPTENPTSDRTILLADPFTFTMEYVTTKFLAPGESVDFEVGYSPEGLELTTNQIRFSIYTDLGQLDLQLFDIQASAANESLPEISDCPEDQIITANSPVAVSWTPPTAQDGACGTFQTGSVNIINYGVDGTGVAAFSMVLLKDIPNGTILNITNRGWQASGGFAPAFNGEGTYRWQADLDMLAGTVVNFTASDFLGYYTLNPDLGYSASGFGEPIILEEQDQLFIYTGAEPTTGFETNFLAAIDWSGGWDADATDASTSTLPPAFTNGLNAISFNTSISHYDCSVTNNTSNAISQAIMDPANWTATGSVLSASPCSFSPTTPYAAPIVLTSNYDPGAIFPLGTTTVTYSGTSSSGIQVNCSFDVTIVNVGPEISLWGNGQEITNGASTASLADHSDFGELPACSGHQERTFTIQNSADNDLNLTATPPDLVSITGSGAAHFTVVSQPTALVQAGGQTDFTIRFDPSVAGTHSATVQIANDDQDEDPYTFTIAGNRLLDTSPPTVFCFGIFLHLDANGEVEPNPNGLFTGSDNCSTEAELIASAQVAQQSFTCDDIGPNLVLVTVTDGGGNTATCEAQVTIVDNTPPTGTCQDITVQLDANGQATISAQDVVLEATDNCSTLNFNLLYDSFSCNELGLNSNHVQITDVQGNIDFCSFNVTVEDPTAPEAACQDITVQLDANGLGSFTADDVDNGSSDNCSLPNLGISFDQVSCADIPSAIVTLTATDTNGASSSCTANVTVEDNSAPTVLCQDVTVQLDAFGEASISVQDVDLGSSDNCAVSSSSLNRTNFSCVETTVGAISNYLEVIDVHGNSEACPFTVVVEDHVVPNAVCQDITVQLDANGQASLTPDQIDNGSNDNCSIANMALDIEQLSCADMPSTSVSLTITDDSGNSSSCTATVTIEDNTAPTATCQDITVQLDANGEGNFTAEDVDNGTADNCSLASLEVDFNQVSCADIPSTSVTLTATDENGNSHSCVATVTVEDLLAPTVACQDATVVLNSVGEGGLNAVALHQSSSDNCSIDNIEASPNYFTCNDLGDNIVILTVEDPSGNAATCTATVSVERDNNPSALCQDITVQLDGDGQATFTADEVDNGSSDYCGLASLEVNFNQVSCADMPSKSVTLTATGISGNSSSCTAVVTIEDHMAPTALCQDITIELDANGQGSFVAEDVDNGSADNCSIATLEVNFDQVSCADISSNTVTLTASDNNGNSSSCTANVTVEDNLAPSALCQDVTVQLNANGNASITLQDVDLGSAENCQIFEMVLDRYNFSCADVATTPVANQLIIYDVNGNIGSCAFSVLVQDQIPPTAQCQDITVQLDANGQASLTPDQIDNGSSDNCSIANMTLNIEQVSCADLLSTSVSLMITDNSGNSSSCNATVTIEDNTAPTIACQDITVELDGNGQGSFAAEDVDNGSSDNCSIATLEVDFDQVSCADLPATIVTLTAIDNSGNASSCTANVTVEDNSNPAITCPVDITTNTDPGSCETIITYEISTSDNCAGASWSMTEGLGSGSSFPIGTTTNSFLVTDAAGNTNTCSFEVIVEDNEAPSITCPADIIVSSDPGSCEAIVIYNIQTADNCLGETWELTSGLASGSSFPGGMTTNSFTVTDAVGHTSSCSFQVTVLDTDLPSITCPENQVVQNDPGSCGAEIIYNILTEDNCEGETWALTAGMASGSEFPIGTTTNTFIVTDVAGNTNTCSFVVTVNDTELPTITCPANMTLINDEGICGAGVTYDIVTSDNCAGESWEMNFGLASGSIFPVGTTPNSLIVTDASGNSNTCYFEVNVFDEEKPSISCPSHTTISTDPGQCEALTEIELPTATDNCAVTWLQYRSRMVDENNNALESWSAFSPDPTKTLSLGKHRIQWRAEDAGGNRKSCSFYITIEDQEAPVASCQDLTLFQNGESDIPLEMDLLWDETNSTDNCGEVFFVELSQLEISCSELGNTIPVNVTIEDASGNMADCTSNVTMAGLPCDWSIDPEGLGCDPGEGSYDTSTESFSLSSEGCYDPTFYRPSDQHGFIQQELCGDGEIIAQVTSVIGTGWAGISMRESNDPVARMLQLMIDGNMLTRREFRTTPGSAAFAHQFQTQGKNWLRLTREGSQFSAYHSLDGVNWEMVFSINLAMTDCIHIGMITMNGTESEEVTAIFENVSINGVASLVAPNGLDIAQEEQANRIDFSVYPNPASDKAMLQLDHLIGQPLHLRIFNFYGQEVFHQQWEEVTYRTEQLNLSDFPPGTYIIEIISGNQRTSKKLVVTKP